MKKLIMSLFSVSLVSLVMFITSSVASAENPKAAQFREILNSNSYYVEYDFIEKIFGHGLAVDGDKKISYHADTSVSALNYVPVISVISNIISMNNPKLKPDFFYQPGKYYQFIDKKSAVLATERDLNDPYLDPNEGWKYAKECLELPKEFEVFTNDLVKFVESGNKVVGNTQISFDKYVKPIKSIAGNDIAKTVYFVCYNAKGNLDTIISFNVEWNEDAGQIFDSSINTYSFKARRTIKIKKITKSLPRSGVNMPKGCKVYRAGIGDINDLTDQLVLVEQY